MNLPSVCAFPYHCMHLLAKSQTLRVREKKKIDHDQLWILGIIN